MIDFTVRYPIFLPLLFFIFSSAVSYYFYRKYSLSLPKKLFLIALKTAALFLLLVLFAEPSLLMLTESDSNKNLILIDNSRSNELNGANNETKSIAGRKILSELTGTNIGGQIFTFSSPEATLIQISDPDSISFNGYETDLSGSFTDLKAGLIDERIGSITVISDGVFNSGGNPLYSAKQFQCPVITIGIGDTLQKKDASLKAIYYEPRAFTNTNNIIRVKSVFHLFNGENFDISLFREGSLIQSKTVSVNKDFQLEQTNFIVRETEPGIVKYSIEVTGNLSEVTYRNNQQEILIDYIDNKTNILLISSGPGYDNATILNILSRTNYNLAVRTIKTPNEFYEGSIEYKTFGELSAVFLLGFPISGFSSELTNSIASKVLEFNLPVIFFAQKNTDYKKLEAFGEQIPFYFTGTQSAETQFTPVVTASVGELNYFGKDINSTPQIFKNAVGILPKAGCVTLFTDKSTGEPVLMTRDLGKTKSTAFLGYGLWRWDLTRGKSYRKTLENFLIECINLSLMKEKKTKFKVYPVTDVFDYTQKINLIAEVYDDEFKLTGNSSITARIIQNNSTIINDIKFILDGNKYSVTLPSLPAGDYKIEAEAEKSGNFYAKDESRFLVDSINTEYLETKSNFNNLKELSLNTGGLFFAESEDPGEISGKISELLDSYSQVPVVNRKKNNLWENKYWLLLIIFLFSAEWILRKRNNIP